MGTILMKQKGKILSSFQKINQGAQIFLGQCLRTLTPENPKEATQEIYKFMENL